MKRKIVFIVFLMFSTFVGVDAAEFRRAVTFEDAHAASCRITAGNSRGTGTFVGVDDGNAYILTCDHVVKGNKNVLIDFWTNSQKQTVSGVVVWESFDTDLPGDFAFIAVNAENLKNEINPPFVALGGSDAKPSINGFIVSSGAPDGRFPQAWKGKVVEYYRDATALFSPPPVPGQSGSGILEHIDGELYLTGVLTWLIGTKGADDSKGGAIPVKNIYIAMNRGRRAPTALERISPIPPDASECSNVFDSVANEFRRPKILFYSGADCPLCEKVAPAISRLEDEGEDVERVDVRTPEGFKRAKTAGVVMIPTVVVDAGDETKILGPEKLDVDAYEMIKGAAIQPRQAVENFLDREPVRQEAAPIRGIMEKSENRWKERKADGGILPPPSTKKEKEEETPEAVGIGDRIADRIAEAMGKRIEEEARRITSELETSATAAVERFIDQKIEAVKKSVWKKVKALFFWVVVVVSAAGYFLTRKKR